MEQALSLTIKGIEEIERFVAILQLGLMTAIRHELITCVEAEERFYSPHTYSRLEAIGVDSRLVEATNLGMMELDAVRRHVPDAYQDSIDEIIDKVSEVLRKLPTTEGAWVHWLD